MATQIKHRRGSKSEIDNFTPAVGEIVVDTDNNELVLGDGVKAGGFPVPKKAETNLNLATMLVAKAAKSVVVGDTVSVRGRNTESDGGYGVWVYITKGTTANVDLPNDLTIIACTNLTDLAIKLRNSDDGTVNLVAAGIVADNATDQKAAIESVSDSTTGDLVLPSQALELKLSAAPNIGSKSVILSKFDQVDPLILADMQAMVSEKGYRGGTPQATQFKKWGLDVISGVLRKVAEGTDKWKFISNAQGDADHETIGFDNSIQYTADATSLTLPLNLLTTPTSEVLSVICAPDETLAAYGLTVGASVGTSQLQLQMSFDNKFGRSFRYDGAPNFVMTTIYGSIYAVSFSIISPNVMRVVFPRMVAPKIVMTPAGTGIPHYPTVKSFNNAYTMDIKFLDLVAGTLNPSLGAQHDFNLYMEDRTVMQLNGSTGGAPSDVGDKILTTGTSNIWIYGIQKAIG